VLELVEGNTDRAIASLRRGVQLEPNHGAAHGNLALALAMKGNFAQADKELKLAVMFGYANAEVVKGRIDRLKKLAEE